MQQTACLLSFVALFITITGVFKTLCANEVDTSAGQPLKIAMLADTHFSGRSEEADNAGRFDEVIDEFTRECLAIEAARSRLTRSSTAISRWSAERSRRSNSPGWTRWRCCRSWSITPAFLYAWRER